MATSASVPRSNSSAVTTPWTNQVHDPAEDEPHIVGIPKRFLVPDDDGPDAATQLNHR